MKEFHEINNSLPSSNIDRERSPNAIEVINRYFPSSNRILFIFILNCSLRRYCARLPCDALTTLVPSCKIKKYDENQYQCILSLPVNSPARTTITVRLKTIHSPFYLNYCWLLFLGSNTFNSTTSKTLYSQTSM